MSVGMPAEVVLMYIDDKIKDEKIMWGYSLIDLDNKMQAKMQALDAKMETFDSKMEAFGAKMEAFEAKTQCTDANVRAEAMEHAEVRKRTEWLEDWCKMLDEKMAAFIAHADANVRVLSMELAAAKRRTKRLQDWCKKLEAENILENIANMENKMVFTNMDTDAKMEAFVVYAEAVDAKMEALDAKMEAKMECTDANVRAEAMEHADVKKRTDRLEQWCKMLDTQAQAGDKKVAALVDARKSFVLWHAGFLVVHIVLLFTAVAWSRSA
jgi:hypothetical protein